jgi:hypothetical protein
MGRPVHYEAYYCYFAPARETHPRSVRGPRVVASWRSTAQSKWAIDLPFHVFFITDYDSPKTT